MSTLRLSSEYVTLAHQQARVVCLAVTPLTVTEWLFRPVCHWTNIHPSIFISCRSLSLVLCAACCCNFCVPASFRAPITLACAFTYFTRGLLLLPHCSSLLISCHVSCFVFIIACFASLFLALISRASLSWSFISTHVTRFTLILFMTAFNPLSFDSRSLFPVFLFPSGSFAACCIVTWRG